MSVQESRRLLLLVIVPVPLLFVALWEFSLKTKVGKTKTKKKTKEGLTTRTNACSDACDRLALPPHLSELPQVG